LALRTTTSLFFSDASVPNLPFDFQAFPLSNENSAIGQAERKVYKAKMTAFNKDFAGGF
jgi:hypothetical protein